MFRLFLLVAKQVRKWLRGRACTHVKHPIQTPKRNLFFRKLEKRRVLAVDAFFVGGSLSVEITSSGQTTANLIANGSDFFVDSNNNLALDVGEVSGPMANLQNVHVFSNESIGKLFWNGDFGSAPMSVPQATGDVIRTEGIAEAHLNMSIHAAGNATYHTLNVLQFNSNAQIDGNLDASVSNGFLSDGAQVSVHVTGDANLQSDNSIFLANEALSSWKMDGITSVTSNNSIQLGALGNWNSNVVRLIGNDIMLSDQDDISIQQIQTLGPAHLLALGNILDTPNAQIDIAGNAILEGRRIVLADTAGDTLHIAGSVDLIATAGDITIAAPGNVALGDISASGINIDISEDESMSLFDVHATGHLETVSADAITDVDGATIQALQWNAQAIGPILLGDHPHDSIVMDRGTSVFHSMTGNIEIAKQGDARLADVLFQAEHGNVDVGGIGITQFGLVSASADLISIQEDSDMLIRSAVALRSISLQSDSSILNTVVSGIVTPELTIVAGTYAHLGTVSIGTLTANVGANGTLDTGGLFSLNSVADQTGQKYLDAFRQNLPPGVSASEQLISGETLSQLAAKASFVQSFGREYGLFVQNDRQLELNGIAATGDDIHLLVETPRGQNLLVAGDIVQHYTGTEPGGLVLIAGNQLLMAPGVRLVIEANSLDTTTLRTVTQPDLVAQAFDGAKGPSGFESTRDVLYPEDAFADTGTQNVLQRVATQFGAPGESGFQTMVRYADGSGQLFDANQEVFAARNVLNATGVLQAHPLSSGDVAVFQRSTPMPEVILGTFQTLPTSVLFRRSSEFFLFEQSGTSDAAITKSDLTPVIDIVDNVFSPGRKISFPMPSEIIVTPAILVASTRVVSNSDTVYPNSNDDVQTTSVRETEFEVYVIEVGFDDADHDGQPSDRELPSRDELRLSDVPAISVRPNNDDASEPSHALMPGQPNLASKDIKGTSTPSTNDVQRWVEEYRADPTKSAGAYAIVSVDNIVGAKVLKVFGVRDLDSDASSTKDAAPIAPSDEVPMIPENKTDPVNEELGRQEGVPR